jgi:hypothetical protein
MSRDLLIAVGGGLLCALFYLSFMTGSPGAFFMAYFLQFPLFLVGLSLGWLPAAIACVVAAVVVAFGANPAAAGMFSLVSAVPVLIISRQALLAQPGTQPGTRLWYPPGLLFGWLTGYGLLLFGLAVVLYSGVEGGLEGAARAFLEAKFETLGMDTGTPEIGRMIGLVVPYFPALVAASWFPMVVVNAVLAQGALTQFKRNRRPSPKFTTLDLPGWMTTALAVALLASFIPGRIGMIGQNAAIILTLPFFFLGLAVIHSLSHRIGPRGLFLGLVYVFLVLSGWLAIFIAGLGIIEQWALLRRRFAAAGKGRENE